MDRLTKRTPYGVAILNHSSCFVYTGIRCGLIASQKIQAAIERLAEIEDILGDDYDLDRLRKLVEAFDNHQVLLIPKEGIKWLYRFGPDGLGTAELPEEELKSPRETDRPGG